MLRTRSLRALFIAATGVLLVATLAVPGVAAQSYDVPARPDGPVLDAADLLSRTEEARLAQKLMTYEDTTSTALVVVTLATLDGAPISDYAVMLGREWQIGQQGKDNGVVVLVSRDERKVFIATGYGLEGAIPDAVANRIVDGIITPAFRQGDFYAGLDRGTDAIIQAARGEFTADRPTPGSSRRDDDGFPALGFILMIFIYFIITSIRRGGGGPGKKRRKGGSGPIIIWGGGGSSGGFGGGGGFSGGGGFGGFGGGSFGGGGAGGSW